MAGGIMGSVEAAAQPTPELPAEASETPRPDATADRPSEPGGQPGQDAGGERDENGHFLSREAAGYRRRLRETETERDQLREQRDRLQRAEVERLAGGAGLAVAADVWLHNPELSSFRAEDGSVDAATVEGMVADLIKDRPGLAKPVVGSGRLGEGSTAAGRYIGQPGPGLSQLLKPGRA